MRLLFLNYETPLGTAMHATPVYSQLRAARPDWEINVAAAGMGAEVLLQNPHIDRLWVTPHALNDGRGFFRWAIRNRRKLGRFDAIVYNSDNRRTKLGVLSRFIRTKRRVGYAVRKPLVDSHLEYDDSVSLIENNLRVLDFLGINRGGKADPQLWYRVADADAAQVERIQFGSGPLIGFFTSTSGGHPNQWYDERFIAVSRDLARLVGARSAFFGGPKDVVHTEHLAKACGSGAVSLAGKTTVQRLAAFCAMCDLIITVDTGGLHVAWAVGSPAVVLGHAANPAHIWLPQDNPKVRVIRKDDRVPCAHCRKHTCLTRECMDEITVAEVVAAALDHLRAFPAESISRDERLSRWVNHTACPILSV